MYVYDNLFLKPVPFFRLSGVNSNNMPRVYKPDPRGKRYKKVDVVMMAEAIKDVRNGMSLRAAGIKYNFEHTIICRHMKKEVACHSGEKVERS